MAELAVTQGQKAAGLHSLKMAELPKDGNRGLFGFFVCEIIRPVVYSGEVRRNFDRAG